MKEIKFRGKRVDNGEWVYGNGIKISNNGTVIIYDNKKLEWIEVISETVGQFTGLKDKNGVEIYEGNIILMTNILSHLLETEIFIVIWEKGSFKLQGIDKYSEYIISEWDELIKDSCKVVGNFYETPEFLKREKVNKEFKCIKN